MTPKEKAKELFAKMQNSNDYEGYCPGCGLVEEQARDIALIFIDEILNAIDWHKFETPNNEINYWQEVKKELESDSLFLI